MPFATVGDLRMYYETRGSGPRLLIISGTGGDLRRPPSPFDTPLAQHFQILAYDQRGFGQTSRPDIAYTMADYANDAHGLLDAMGWDGCTVMGVSFGGMVAQELALRYPHQVERLVLACTSSGGAGGSSYPLHELGDMPDEERVRKTIEIIDVRNNSTWQKEHPEEFKSLFNRLLAARQPGAADPGREMGARRQLEARSQHNTYERLHSLRMPVYLCGGRYDGIAKPVNLEVMLKKIPGARLEFFEGGHLFLSQDPQAYESIKSFLLGK